MKNISYRNNIKTIIKFGDIRNMESLAKLIVRILNYAFYIIFTWIFINVCMNNNNTLIKFNMALDLVIGVIFFKLLSYLLFQFKQDKKINKKILNYIKEHNKKLVVISVSGLFIMQIIFAYTIYAPIGWDVGTSVEIAHHSAISAEPLRDHYVETYPNNLLLIKIISTYLKIVNCFGVSNIWFALIIVNIILVDISIIFVFLICKKLFGIKGACIALSINIFIFGFSPWITVPYSDTFSIAFAPAIFFLYIKQKEVKKVWNRNLLLLLIGLIGMLGFEIKPTSMIIVIAIMLFEFLNCFKNFTSMKVEKFCRTIALMGVGIMISTLLFGVAVKKTFGKELDFSNSTPVTHFLMLGMNERHINDNTVLYGAWNEEDVNLTMNKTSKKEKIEANLYVIKQRLHNFGVIGYIEFLSNKAAWTFCDGTFYWGGEGNWSKESFTTNKLGQFMQNVFRFKAQNYYLFANIVQGIWIIILFLMIIPGLFKVKFDIENKINVILFTIFGLLIFQLLFETRARYIINHIPIFVILATNGFLVLNKKICKSKVS